MLSRSTVIFVSAIFGVISSFDVFAEDLVGFRFVAKPDTVKEFIHQFDERVTKNRILDKLCSKPDYQDPLLSGVLEYLPHAETAKGMKWQDRTQAFFKRNDRDTLIFVCDAKEEVFTEVGAVFLAATPPHSPRPDAELDTLTGSCPNKHCPAEGSIDCITYGGVCYHRNFWPQAAHKCVCC